MLNGITGLITAISLFAATPLNTTTSNIYYYELDDNGIEYLSEEKILTRFNQLEERIHYTISCLFENNNNKITLIPDNVKVTHILVMNGYLEMEVSDDILDYGGTLWEEGMINQLLATLFSFEEIESVSLYVEGKGNIFVEGTVINEYTINEWNERKCHIWQE